MKTKNKYNAVCLTLAMTAVSLAGSLSGYGQDATATISGTPVSGGFDYTILLTNTGGDNLEGFWYAWTDSGNNLVTTPSGAGNLQGWGNSVLGGPFSSIQWQGTAGNALAPGATGTFTFFSATDPTDITTSPSGESVAYTGTIQFNEGVTGTSTAVFSPVLVTVPEPSSMVLAGVGLMGLLAMGRRKLGGK